MDRETFITDYLKPSADGLDSRFAVPLPSVPGLSRSAGFIVQGRRNDTVSTNIITLYKTPDDGIRLIEVYKNSEDREKGIFIRLVGTMALRQKGFPFMFLDAAVSNVSPLTAQKEELATRVAVHMPQADSTGRQDFFERLSGMAHDAGISCGTRQIDALPGFWGPLWSARAEGLDLDFIGRLRENAWIAYSAYCESIPPLKDFDYAPVQHQMVYNNARAEHRLFERMGLSVPAEAQAAFFCILSFTE